MEHSYIYCVLPEVIRKGYIRKQVADDDHVVEMPTTVEDLWKKTKKNVGAMVTAWL